MYRNEDLIDTKPLESPVPNSEPTRYKEPPRLPSVVRNPRQESRRAVRPNPTAPVPREGRIGTLLTGMLLLLITMAFSACEPTTSSSPSPPVTDSELESQIRAKLNSDTQLKTAGIEVRANATRNEATLTGEVPTPALEQRAIELTRGVRTGLVVNDKIEVKPREVSRTEYTEEQARAERSKAKDLKDQIGDSLDDAWIHMKIVAKLIGDADTPERKINVDVVDNVVTLRGTVDSPQQKAEAERIAKETDGVKSVKNQLKVGKS
jgi:hyperosmotically inducible protein